MKLLSISDLQKVIKPVNYYEAEQIASITLGRHLKTSELLKVKDIDKYNQISILVGDGRKNRDVITMGFNESPVIGRDSVSYTVEPTETTTVQECLQDNASVIDEHIFTNDFDGFGYIALRLSNYHEQPEIELGEEVSPKNGSSKAVEQELQPKVTYLTLDEFKQFFNYDEEPVEPEPQPFIPVE